MKPLYKNRYSYDVWKNAVQVYNFLNSFVQDCSYVILSAFASLKG